MAQFLICQFRNQITRLRNILSRIKQVFTVWPGIVRKYYLCAFYCVYVFVPFVERVVAQKTYLSLGDEITKMSNEISDQKCLFFRKMF